MTIALLIALLSSAAADPGPVLAAADAFDRAQIAKDRAALDRMVLDELVLVDGSGKRLGKKQFIDGWTAAADKFDPITLIDRTVTPLGRYAAVVGAEVNLCGTSAGTRFCSRIRFADTFVLVDGVWKVAHIQVTPIKD